MKACHVIPKILIGILPLLLVTSVSVQAGARVSNSETTKTLTRKHDPVPQIMVSNFFNILIQGAQAITAETSEEQIKATANVLNSIANIAQLAMRSADTRLSEQEYRAIHELSAKLYKTCIKNKDFMQALQDNREAAHTQLAELFESKFELKKELV